MKEFNLWDAWSWGVRFFSGAALNHAILLLGVGVALPILLQILLFGRPLVMLNGAGALDGAAPGPEWVQLVTAAGYVLQTASFFASRRLGFGQGTSLSGALLYGLVVGAMVSIGVGFVLVVVGFVFGLITVPVALIAIVVAFVGLFAIAWTAYAAILAVLVCLLFLLALAFGAAMGNLTFAATIVGGSGAVWTFLVAASLVLLWLAARLSCTAVLMAERGSFHVFAAMRESWSLTWDDEWRITRYLGLLGLVAALLIGGAIALAGAGVVASLTSAGGQGSAMALVILLSALSVPLAYLAVLVPAGIYRELVPADAGAAEVFI